MKNKNLIFTAILLSSFIAHTSLAEPPQTLPPMVTIQTTTAHAEGSPDDAPIAPTYRYDDQGRAVDMKDRGNGLLDVTTKNTTSSQSQTFSIQFKNQDQLNGFKNEMMNGQNDYQLLLHQNTIVFPNEEKSFPLDPKNISGEDIRIKNQRTGKLYTVRSLASDVANRAVVEALAKVATLGAYISFTPSPNLAAKLLNDGFNQAKKYFNEDPTGSRASQNPVTAGSTQ